MQEPPEKRRKPEELSSLEVTDLISKVVTFRREGPKILHEILSAETEEMLKWLRNMKVEVADCYKTIIPDLTNIPASPNWDKKQTVEERLRRITLLTVLEKKAKCPIARIIDEI